MTNSPNNPEMTNMYPKMAPTMGQDDGRIDGLRRHCCVSSSNDFPLEQQSTTRFAVSQKATQVGMFNGAQSTSEYEDE